MSTKLEELFRAGNGAPVQLQGKTVRMMYELSDLRKGQGLEIIFGQVSSDRAQALRLKARGGRLEVNGQILEDVVLWSDNSPRAVGVTTRPISKSMSVRMWNAWRDPNGSMQAWIGNAGMVVAD